jgi:hypothetical protein
MTDIGVKASKLSANGTSILFKLTSSNHHAKTPLANVAMSRSDTRPRLTISSITPEQKAGIDAMIIGPNTFATIGGVSHQLNISEIKIAIPPTLGVGWLCTFCTPKLESRVCFPCKS